MLPHVVQHVHQSIAHFARRSQHAVVVALREHGTAQPERTVHCPRDPRSDRHHPAPERLRPVRLDQQVHVVALEREVHDSERALLGGLRERPLDFAHDSAVSQRRQAATHAQRHVTRLVPADVTAQEVGNPRVRGALPTGAITPAAPADDRSKRQCQLTIGLRC
jgi:hypothetical protein